MHKNLKVLRFSSKFGRNVNLTILNPYTEFQLDWSNIKQVGHNFFQNASIH